MSKLIGRISEIRNLNDSLQNNQSELIAVYGRRRVGKTFLIREFYKKELIFEVTGLFEGGMKEQLYNFTKEIKFRSKTDILKQPQSWFEAFSELELYIKSFRGKKKKVIFIDEFPWIASPKSNFLMAFENFWNNFCTRRTDLIVVICGSAASYMVQKIIRNKGGLHNRITRKIRLLPFNLQETDLFLKSRGIKYTKYDILQIYMAMGGVPHYLEKLQKGLSVAQNIDALCFEKDGVLNDEFNQLFNSLFDESERHMSIIKALAEVNKGITRDGLLTKMKLPSSGDFTLKMAELMESGFITEYPFFKNKKQLSLFRLSDEYSKFYLKFIQPNKNNGLGTWQRLSINQSYTSWSGFAFETVCLKHVNQLKKAMRIEAIYSKNSSWFNANAQIDLLIDRDDNVMNLCEIKFHKSAFSIDKNYYLNLKNKISELQKETKTKKNIFITMITTHGVKENEYSIELIENKIDINKLFM
jgi:AAA+ ATPase superfamily predicted ATPase